MIDLLKTLNQEELAKVKTINLNNGQILFNEGDVCECVGVIISGEIDILSYSFGGKEIIYNHLTPGMVFGNNLIFSSEPRYKGSIIAKKPAKIGLIYKKELITLLQNNEQFMLSYFKYQSDNTKQLNDKIKLLSIDNAEERFFYYAYMNDGKIAYSTITKLAATLSLQRETLSRLLSKLIHDKKIIKEKHLIKVIKK